MACVLRVCCLSPSLTLYFHLVPQELNEYVNERKRQTDNRNFIIKLQEQITEMPLVHTAMLSADLAQTDGFSIVRVVCR